MPSAMTLNSPESATATSVEVIRRGDQFEAIRCAAAAAAGAWIRRFEPRYPSQPALRAMIEAAGFEVLEERDAFLAGLCRLVWARAGEPPPRRSGPA